MGKIFLRYSTSKVNKSTEAFEHIKKIEIDCIPIIKTFEEREQFPAKLLY
jgi:hypothetical protein